MGAGSEMKGHYQGHRAFQLSVVGVELIHEGLDLLVDRGWLKFACPPMAFLRFPCVLDPGWVPLPGLEMARRVVGGVNDRAAIAFGVVTFGPTLVEVQRMLVGIVLC